MCTSSERHRQLDKLNVPLHSPTGFLYSLQEREEVLGLVDYSNEGRKDDGDKLRMDLLPPEFLTATATILTFGAQKYSDRNWEKGMSWGRVFGALMRHMWAWWGGKGSTSTNFAFGEIDDETGFSHLWHASCCIAFLVAYEQRKIGTDDRA